MSVSSFRNRKERLFFLAAVLYIIYLIFPLFYQLTRTPVEIPAMVVVIVCSVLYPSIYRSKVVTFSLLYLGILSLYLLMGKSLTIGIGNVSDARKFLVEAAWLLPSALIYSSLQYINSKVIYRKIALFSVVALVLSFIYLIPTILTHSNILRENVASMAEDGAVVGALPNYTLMHAYTYLIPALCYAIKIFPNRTSRYMWAGVIVLFYYMIIHTYVTTSLFVSTTIIIASLLYKQNGKRGITTFFIIAIIVLVLYKLGVVAGIIDLLLPVFQGTAVEPKLFDIKYSLSVGQVEGGSLTGRMDYHQMSIDAFFSNPLFGTESVGGHSSLLDRLGGMGLFAFIPFLMIFVSFIQSVREFIITNSAKFFWFCSILAPLVFLYTKAQFGAEGWLFFFVIAPSLLIYIQDKAELNPDK